jgi:bifunctional UDP-N-acetylglucosamine pyrophosphorylase/glucosamine-1-phosphate N-acetyltransferase
LNDLHEEFTVSSGALGIILAAGKSTRMKSALPKVLHEVCGRPMIEYVLDAARASGVSRIVAVVGHRAELVQAELSRHADVEFALQAEQKGTGHAIMMCRDQLASHDGPVLVLAGDTPLLKSESLTGLLKAQADSNAAAVIGTTDTQANQGLGRIVRDAAGKFERIVEERDATDEQKRIQEINTGCYAFDSKSLLSALDRIRPDNNQAEYYLTDCPLVLKRDGKPVVAAKVFEVSEAMGVNTRAQLADVTRAIQQVTLARLMANGVSIAVPELTYIDPRAVIGSDTVILPFTHIQGPVVIGADCRIGPHAVLQGKVEVPAGTQVAPFTFLKS